MIGNATTRERATVAPYLEMPGSIVLTRDSTTSIATSNELKELIMHAAVYAGMPAASTAMHEAEDVIRELAQTPPETP